MYSLNHRRLLISYIFRHSERDWKTEEFLEQIHHVESFKKRYKVVKKNVKKFCEALYTAKAGCLKIFVDRRANEQK